MTIKDNVSALNSRVEEMQLDRDHEKRQSIAKWLSSLNFKSRQRDVFSRREEGTRKWLLDSPEFKAWLDEPGQTLWCPGIREYFRLRVVASH